MPLVRLHPARPSDLLLLVLIWFLGAPSGSSKAAAKHPVFSGFALQRTGVLEEYDHALDRWGATRHVTLPMKNVTDISIESFWPEYCDLLVGCSSGDFVAFTAAIKKRDDRQIWRPCEGKGTKPYIEYYISSCTKITEEK